MFDRKLTDDPLSLLISGPHNVSRHDRSNHNPIRVSGRRNQIESDVVPTAPAKRISRLYAGQNFIIPDIGLTLVGGQHKQHVATCCRLSNRYGLKTFIARQLPILVVTISDNDLSTTVA